VTENLNSVRSDRIIESVLYMFNYVFADMPENVWWTLYVDLISNSQCDYKLDQAL